MKQAMSLFTGTLLVSSLLVLQPPVLAQATRKLILGMPSVSGGLETYYIAKKIGAYKRHGLDVDLVLFQGGTQALQVLLSGDAKMVIGGGTSGALQARMKGGGNVIIATPIPTMPYSLFVSSKIKEPRQLKGGKVAVSRYGSSSDFAMRFMLAGLGLDPNKDVTIMQIGNQQGRFTALSSGAVDGTVIEIPNTLLARRLGFVRLADASSLGLAYPQNSLTTTDAFIRAEPETVMNFTRAFVDAIAYYKNHKAESVQMIKEFLSVKEDALAEEAYDYFSRIIPQKPYPSVEGLRTVLNEIAKSDPAAKNVKPEHFMDSTFVRRLDESGYIDGLYKK